MLVGIAALAVTPSAAAGAEFQGQEIVVRSSAARPAIQRILEADNLDVERLPADEVAARMREIGRGAAPAEFWTAYQAHVKAWTDYAEAKARARRTDPLQIADPRDAAAIVAARRRINATFDVVEAIAKRHGAWPPRTPTRF
jgi:uncharacterized 2Fe-2S/4Fe-4S cluster protein (DUF4445 family)